MSLQPDIKEISIGIREIKKRTIYPLSFAQQTRVGTQLVSMFSSIVDSADEMTDMDFAKEIVMHLIQVIPDIIIDCSDITKEEFENDITNTQLLQIAEIIYSVNFEGVIKNGQSLLQKMQGALPQMSSSPSSSNTIQASLSKPSMKKGTKKEG